MSDAVTQQVATPDAEGHELHRVLARQLASAADEAGVIDTYRLSALVSATYEEMDLERRRGDRANRLMAEELQEASDMQQQLLDELQAQNARIGAALDNMSQGLCLFNAEGRLVMCNARFRA